MFRITNMDSDLVAKRRIGLRTCHQQVAGSNPDRIADRRNLNCSHTHAYCATL